MKNFSDFTLSVIRELEKEGRFGTAHVYRSTLRAFTAFRQRQYPETRIPMQKTFSPALLRAFEQHLRGRMLRMNTISTYMRMLRALYHRALNRGLMPYVPGLFDHVYTGTCSDVKRALRPSDMGQLLTLPATDNTDLKKTQNWFALLFLLRGMPFADLARLQKSDLQNGIISYRRQKTGKKLTVRLTAQAGELINSCADTNRDSPYLLNILQDGRRHRSLSVGSRAEYRRYQSVLRSFNRSLKELACQRGIRSNLSSYTARHTWATTAYHKKCSVGIISNALGHSSVKVTETYLKPFENEVLDRTNQKIISYIKKYAQS